MGLSKSELSFQKEKIEQKKMFIKEWMNQCESVGLHEDIMTRIQLGCLGTFLHNILFVNWSYCGVQCDRPAVSFSEKCLVGKYAHNVIYYVSGWTLYKMSKALTIGKMQREQYFNFAREQCLDARSAKDAGLPTSIVERRKRFAKTFCTQQYFEFICFVESTFISNLNLTMMMAYADGDLVH